MYDTNSNNNNNNNNNNNKGSNEEFKTQLSEIFLKLLFHWPLYLLVLSLSAFGAYLYLRYTRPIYSSSAKIYIKDEKKAGANRQLNALEDFSMFSSSKLVENEMEVIKSPLILNDVIRHNKFNIRYFAKGRISEYEMYENSPIKIAILSDSANVGNYFFSIEPKEKSYIEISYSDKAGEDHTIHTRFNAPFSVGKDRFSIRYLPQFRNKNTVGYKIKVDSIEQLAYKKSAEVATSLINKQASVVEIRYEDPISKRSADFLNAVLERYNQYTLNDKNQTVLNTINFIDNRLQSLGGELDVLERNVETFKKSRGIIKIDESSKLFLEQVKEADQKLDEANIQLSVYDQIERYISSSDINSPFAPVLGNVDPALTSLINRYQELHGERKRLSLSLQPGNQIVQNLDQQISDARRTIKNYIAGFRRNARTVKQGLQQKVSEIEGQISKVPEYERQFINLHRQQGVKEALYLFLLQKKEESAVSYASNIIDNKIISPAFVPLRPVKPQKIVIVLGFLLGGFFLTSVYLYVKYLMNPRVTLKKEIEKIMERPVIAEIYYQETEEFMNSKKRTVITEQMLNLKTNLRFFLNDITHSPVILFTSSISGEGKTYLSAHLANSLTSNGKKVILLELDLRKPKLSKSLNVSNQSGITNYIIGIESLDQVIKKVPQTEDLYIIPSGPIPPNPTDIIESDKMRELFSLLRTRFDYIVIDTAPVGLVSDAKNLVNFADCTLFVTRFNYTPKSLLFEVSDTMNSLSLKKLGLIFNGITQASYYGYYNYGYGYDSNGYLKSNSKTGISLLLQKLKSRLV